MGVWARTRLAGAIPPAGARNLAIRGMGCAMAGDNGRTMWRAGFLAVLGCLMVPAWALADQAPALTSPVTVVPAAGLPPQVADNRSNNNVHVTMHRGRLYMVFRTAKWHIASDDAALYVVSTRDQ